MDEQKTTTAPVPGAADVKPIKMLMGGLDYTIPDLAELTGLSERRVRQILNQSTTPSWDELRKIWIALSS